ncbi:MAG: hypothetical protein HY291_11620 [Planctomycetes bacterium]|nr:hypothetical protein [Planctomycetota bacterium]
MSKIKLKKFAESNTRNRSYTEDFAALTRTSAGSPRSRCGHCRHTDKASKQLRRIKGKLKQPLPEDFRLYELRGFPPGEGTAYWSVVADIIAGKVKILVIEDVSRLTHSLNRLCELWL